MRRRDSRWRLHDPLSRQSKRQSVGEYWSEHLVDFFRLHLQQIVSIHQSMFQKLLFEQHTAVDRDLAELFQDVGKTYLRISERISENCQSRYPIQD
jgi:hypothetical protein